MSATIVDLLSENAEAFADKYNYKPGFIQRNEYWKKFIDKYSKGIKTAYDMGCGSGIFSFYLSPKVEKVIGIDGAKGMIDLCNKLKQQKKAVNTEFYCESLPLPSIASLPKADLIISSSVIEYVPAVKEVFTQFSQLLNEKSLLILSMPNRHSYYRQFELAMFRLIGKPSYFKFVKNVWTIEQAKQILNQSGYEYIEHAYFNNMGTVSKIIKKIVPEKYASHLFIAVFRKK